jgi:hypothetical protein
MVVQQQHSSSDDGDEGEKIDIPASVAKHKNKNAVSPVTPRPAHGCITATRSEGAS